MSNNEQDKLFTAMLHEALDYDYYIVRGYLTWPTYHSLSCSSVTKLRVGNRKNSSYEICPQKICFFSLEQFQDYYLQLWYLNQKVDLQALHLCRIVTNKMCIFNGDVIHSCGFKSEVSTGNFRVQLVFSSKFFIADLNPWQDIVLGDFQCVPQDQRNKYKFQKDTYSRNGDRTNVSFPSGNHIDNNKN